MTENKFAKKEAFYRKLILSLSIIIPIAVFLLIILPEDYRTDGIDVSGLPLFHAILNGSTAILLIMALIFIKNKKQSWHTRSMIAAFCLSGLFLISYVLYHFVAPPSKYGGEGTIRMVYFFILISHILLSSIVIPLASFAMYRGLAGQFDKHRKIVKYAYPVWLYVAVTGVLVYLFM